MILNVRVTCYFHSLLQDIQIRGVNRDEKSIQMAKQYPNSRHFLTYRHSLRVSEFIIVLPCVSGGLVTSNLVVWVFMLLRGSVGKLISSCWFFNPIWRALKLISSYKMYTASAQVDNICKKRLSWQQFYFPAWNVGVYVLLEPRSSCTIKWALRLSPYWPRLSRVTMV